MSTSTSLVQLPRPRPRPPSLPPPAALCRADLSAGKCSVLAVPTFEVAEELADIVSELLYRSLRKVKVK